MNLPDPEKFGETAPKPSEKIDSEDYHSLFEWEDTEK
jgi:hypothetical protein